MRVRRDRQQVDHGGDRLGADVARAQQHRAMAGQARQVDDGRLDADFALAAIEHRQNLAIGAEFVAKIVAKFIAHVLRRGRADVAELVGRGRSDAALATLERLQQRNGHRMRRAAQAHRVLAAGDGRRDVRRALENQGQRPGPEGGGQLARRVGDLAGPVRQIGVGCQVDDHRMVLRTALGGVDRRHRRRIFGVGAQAIHGFSGKSDQAAGS